MPSAIDIVAGLARIAAAWWPVAVLWHLWLAIVVASRAAGWRPGRRAAGAAGSIRGHARLGIRQPVQRCRLRYGHSGAMRTGVAPRKRARASRRARRCRRRKPAGALRVVLSALPRGLVVDGISVRRPA